VKRHPHGCVLQSHPHANNNPSIAWKDSPSGNAITKIKGPNASLDIRQRLGKSQGILVPIDDILLSELRKNLPPGKGYHRADETTLFQTQSTNKIHTPVIAWELRRPYCTTTGSSLATLIPTIVQLRLFRPTIYELTPVVYRQT